MHKSKDSSLALDADILEKFRKRTQRRLEANSSSSNDSTADVQLPEGETDTAGCLKVLNWRIKNAKINSETNAPNLNWVFSGHLRSNVVMQRGGLDGRIPVFVFPTSLTFYLNDHSTHKQIVTLYNPYEFRISYQILCNAPNRYRVESPQGVIRSYCSLDIVITHSDVCSSNVQAPDKLRFQIYEDGNRQILGKKDVTATLVKGVPDPRSASDSDRFESVQAPDYGAAGLSAGDGLRSNRQRQVFGASQGKNGPSWVLVSAALVCVLALLLPTEGDQTPSNIPTYLHPSANVKIAISFALGMITFAVLKLG